jgi:hypothetical protein
MAQDATTNPAVRLTIDLTGQAFTHAGWSLFVAVPAGVKVSNLGAGNLIPTRGGSEVFMIAPGAVRDGSNTALLEWNSLSEGPLQVNGSNLVAEFPYVEVTNEPANSASYVPTPTVTVSQRLFPRGDFSYLGGTPPDHYVGGDWVWGPDIGSVNDGGVFPFVVEARSAVADEQSHTAELYSGIAFGLAAAALIAGIQEFVKSGTKRPRTED